MSSKSQSKAIATKVDPKSLSIAEKGVKTSRDFRNLMSAIMSDVIAGRLTPNMTNAACNAGGKLLKMVDLEYKYGTNPERPHKALTVAFEVPEDEGIEAPKKVAVAG
jgi:hypothetical protein